MKVLCFIKAAAVFLVILLPASTGLAAETTIEANVSAGQANSMAYSLSVRQTYEPWISTSVFDLTPMAGIGLHVWDRSDATIWGGSIAPGLMLNLYTTSSIQPYLGGSVGGAVVSDDKFGSRDLGSNVLFQTKGIVGAHFGNGLKHRIQGEYTNYSTWGLTSKDDGYSTWGVTYGYSF